MKRGQMVGMLWLLGGLVAAPAVSGQADAWVAWHGCWQAEGAPAGEYLCVLPDGSAGVRMLTVARGAVVAESQVITDGQARRVQTDGCTGNEVALWSADYHRVFLNSELSCEADVKRQASGVFVMTSVGSWISVQAVTIDGRTATRTVRYTMVDDDAAPATVRSMLRQTASDRVMARSAALAPIDDEDVSEAVDRIDAAAVQEWLTATNQLYQLAADQPGGVITRSALDLTGAYADVREREIVHVVERPVEVVHVVEQPVYVTRTYDYRYRRCWDPFFSGVVVGLGRGVSIGVGHAHCGRSYLTRYSPWGYDLFGWRFLRIRPFLVSGRPIIYYCEPNRPARVVYTPRRDDRYPPPRWLPVRSTDNTPVRTAQPRGGSQIDRNDQSRNAIGTPGRPSGDRLAPFNGSSTPQQRVGTSETTPPRYAQPRTPDDGWTTRTTSSTRSSDPVHTAMPRRSDAPTTRDIMSARSSQPEHTAMPRRSDGRSTATPAPGAYYPGRTVVPRRSDPPASATSSARSSQPSHTAMPRSTRPTSDARSTTRSDASAATTRSAPARVARPRGDGGN